MSTAEGDGATGVGEVGCEATGGGPLSATRGVEVGAVGCCGAVVSTTVVRLAAGAAWLDAGVGSTGAGEVQPAARNVSANTTIRTRRICRVNLNLLGSMTLGILTIAANHR